MPPDEDSTEDKKPEAPAKKGETPAKGERARTRNVVLMVLATLALTGVLTLVAETFLSHPKPVGPNGSDTASPTGRGASGGQALTSADPSSITTVAQPIINIAVTSDAIIVDGLEVTKTATIVADGRVGNIEALKKVMDERRGGSSTGGPVGLAVEKGVPRNVIRSVFFTLTLANYRDVHPIVKGDSGASSAAFGDD